jgi:hypothetical protein
MQKYVNYYRRQSGTHTEEKVSYGPFKTKEGKWCILKECCICGNAVEVARYDSYHEANEKVLQDLKNN